VSKFEEEFAQISTLETCKKKLPIPTGNVRFPYRYCTPICFMSFLANALCYIPIWSLSKFSFFKGKTCQSPSLIAEHFPGTVTDFTTCSLPPFSVCTFDLLPKSDNVVTFYQIYLHFPKPFLFTSPSSRPLFMYLTHVLSCFGAILSKNKFPAVFMLISHLTFSFYNF
jgi:hypothetical protein